VFMLLALIPYAVAIVFYGLDTTDLFREAHGKIPTNALLRLTVPVVIGGLMPLALASKNTGLSGADRGILASATAFAMVYGLIASAAIRSPTAFLALYHRFRVGGYTAKRLRGRRVLIATGVLVICYGAGVNIAISAH
jgi:hypothetical protein